MVKQLDLSDWPWITLSTYQSRQGTRGGSSTFITVWLKRFPFADAQCFMHSRKSLWLVVWQVGLSVWKGFVCLCTHTHITHGGVSMFVYASVSTTCTFMHCIYMYSMWACLTPLQGFGLQNQRTPTRSSGVSWLHWSPGACWDGSPRAAARV